MNKQIIIIGSVLIALGVITGILLGMNTGNSLGGPSTDLNYYKTATNSQITCSGSASTTVLAAASGSGQRMSFELTVASSTSITLCKSGSTCTEGAGLTINGNGGSFTQEDSYFGAYTCIGNGVASSTIGISYNQN